jgi:hypothetical protein
MVAWALCLMWGKEWSRRYSLPAPAHIPVVGSETPLLPSHRSPAASPVEGNLGSIPPIVCFSIPGYGER